VRDFRDKVRDFRDKVRDFRDKVRDGAGRCQKTDTNPDPFIGSLYQYSIPIDSLYLQPLIVSLYQDRILIGNGYGVRLVLVVASLQRFLVGCHSVWCL